MRTDELHADDVDASFVPRRRARVSTAELDGEAVLYNEDTGRIHSLDRIATLVWSCFDGAASVRAIAHELAGAFEVDLVVVETDVLTLVRRLGAEGLIVGVAADPADDEEQPPADQDFAPPDVDYEGDTRGCA